MRKLFLCCQFILPNLSRANCAIIPGTKVQFKERGRSVGLRDEIRRAIALKVQITLEIVSIASLSQSFASVQLDGKRRSDTCSVRTTRTVSWARLDMSIVTHTLI